MKEARTQSVSLRSGFDAARAAARKRDIDSHLIESGRTLIAEFSDASFLEQFCGVHRIQRIPKGEWRRHTSTISVVLLDAAEAKIELCEDDLAERFTRGTGNGGQNKNTSDNCVVLLHIPSGIEVRVDSRSQWENRQEARRELSRRLLEHAEAEMAAGANEERRRQISAAERPAKSFTYNTQRDEVVDHDGGRRWKMSSFMKGKF